jgi:hypothetical protein
LEVPPVISEAPSVQVETAETAAPDRVLQALEALRAAEARQISLAGVVRLAGSPRRRLLHELLRKVIEIHQLAEATSEAQRSLLEAHCADTSILLALLAAQP